MKIFVCSSRHLYHKAALIIAALEEMGHVVTLPNSYDDPGRENRMKAGQAQEYSDWKSGMLKKQAEKVMANDAVLALNFEKDGKPNYVGGATFLELFKAWELGKKIFLYNPIPEGILHDELVGMNPVIINGDIARIV